MQKYENHVACEDTIILPAWKKNFTDKQLDETVRPVRGETRR